MGLKHLLSDTDSQRGSDMRFKNAVVIGIVTAIDCTDKHSNVRVLLPDKKDHNGTPMITRSIPVMQVATAAKRQFAVPRINTPVALIKLPNATSDYMVVGSFYNPASPPPVTDPMLDYTVYDDGSTKQFDAGNGQEDWNLKGALNFSADGTIHIKSNTADVLIDPQGNVTIHPAGNVLIQATQITLTGQVIINGNITHTGNMTTSGVHTDSLGHHTSAAREDLERRIADLEARVAALESRMP